MTVGRTEADDREAVSRLNQLNDGAFVRRKPTIADYF